MQASDSVVIIPTYNEKENIENIIRAVFGLKNVSTFLLLTITHRTAQLKLYAICKRNTRNACS